VKVWSDSTVRDTFVVSTRGELALPKIGIFQVASMGAGELQDSVKRAYTALVQDPAVQVAALRRVGVVGEVREPGIYFSDLTMTIADVIALAGGLTQTGDSRRVSIRRESQVFPLDMRSGDGAVAAIESGDQIIVGLRGFWARNPGLLVSTVSGLFYFIISRL
jgi:polysaccharide export outer membrane protein